MKKINSVMILLTLILLSSCGGKPQTSKLEINTAFALANTSYPSGLILYGEKTDGTLKFSTTLESSNQKTIDLEKGSWNLAVIGWKGDGSTNPNFKSGLGIDCGSASVNLSNDSESVYIPVNSTNCSSATFAGTFDLQPIFLTSCGAFYDYIASSNTYSPITASSSDNFCASMPMFLRSPMSHYRIYAVDTIENRTAFSSDCRDAMVRETVSLLPKIPTKKFPFVVKFFNNVADCSAEANVVKQFDLNDGLAASYKFDTDFNMNGGAARLVLPSSSTNRARSPFMNQIPNIQCASGVDCFADTSSTLTWDVNVDWKSSNKDVTLLRNYSGTTCPAGLLNGSNFFSLQSCFISDGALKAKISRNELVCQEPTQPFQGSITDSYQRGNFIYYLVSNSGTASDYIYVYDLQGKLLKKIQASTGHLNVTATGGTNPRIFANSSTSVDYWDFTPATNTISALQTYGVIASKIEVDATGTYFFGTSGNTINVYTFPATTATSSGTASYPITQLQSIGSRLYAMQSGTSTDLFDIQVTGGSIPSSLSSSLVHNDNSMLDFLFDGTYYHITLSLGQIKSYDATFTPLASAPFSGIAGKGIISANNVIYAADANLIDTYVFVPAPGALTPTKNQTGSCQESPSIAGTSVTIGAKTNFGQYDLFNDGYKLAGLRFIGSNPQRMVNFFESLNRGDKDKLETGGYLRKPQGVFSPGHISGLFSREGDCAALKAKLSPAPQTLTFSEAITVKGEGLTITASVTSHAAGTNPIDLAFCDITNFAPLSCPVGFVDYDLTLSATVKHSDSVENFISHISCSGKVGTLEVKEDKTGSKLEMKKLLWNTDAPMGSRYEAYSMEYDLLSNNRNIDVVKLKKPTTSDVIARKISTTISPSKVSGQAMEYQITGGYAMTAFFNISDTPAIFVSSTAATDTAFTFDKIRDSDSFYAMNGSVGLTASACFLASSNSISSALTPGCILNTAPTTTSTGLALGLHSIDQGTEVDDYSDLFYSAFELSP